MARLSTVSVIALTLLVFSGGMASAQTSRNGPKVGFDIGTQTAGQFLSWSGNPKVGFLAGWSFEAPITSQISMLIEPMYIGKGSVTVNPQLKSRTSVGLNYLEMPLMLKLNTDSVPQGLFLTGGLMYGYLLHGTQKNYLDGRLTSTSNYSYTDKTNRAQWSAGIGIGHEMGSWMWELRGQSSLNTFDRLQRSHNVVYSIQLCWRFPSVDEKARKQQEKADME